MVKEGVKKSNMNLWPEIVFACSGPSYLIAGMECTGKDEKRKQHTELSRYRFFFNSAVQH